MLTELWRMWPERRVSMPTQEERLSAVEQAQVSVHEAVSDLNHHVTILIGIEQKQEWDVREMKGSLRSIDGRLNSFEGRFSSLDGHLNSFEGRFETQEHRIESFEQSVNNRFETQDKKLDQILLLLNTLTTKSDQET
jgi:chromosome segregation ATPase